MNDDEARRVLFDKSQPKEARMAAMNVLQPKPAEAREPVGDAEQHVERLLALREEGGELFVTEEDVAALDFALDAIAAASAQRAVPMNLFCVQEAAEHFRLNYNDFCAALTWYLAETAQPQATPRDAGEVVERVAKAIADHIGHGMGEKCEGHARAAIAAMQSPTGEPSDG